MFTLGLAGGLDFVHEQKLDTPENYTYDGAAVLIEDGVVIYAIEEERLDRIKHSNKFPLNAIEKCLKYSNICLQDIDRIAYYVDEQLANALLEKMYLTDPEMMFKFDARSLLQFTLKQGFKCDIDASNLYFYEHKLTHAASAIHHSGFDESLVFVIDNAGGIYNGYRDNNGYVSLKNLAVTSPAQSLQKLCQTIMPFLGFGIFDEYKALALAPYGDSGRYALELEKMYELLPDGNYKLHLERVYGLIGKVPPRRLKSQPTTEHKDLAAALQQSMETIVLHVLEHYQKVTKLENLCLAGGMAENVKTNSAVVYSGLFEKCFIHPAAYDSGCAVGAALLACQDAGQPTDRTQLQNVYWGTDIGKSSDIKAELKRWGEVLEQTKYSNITERAAEILTHGNKVGWLQGRSEFGSHALGNRNIFTDPKSVQNRERLHKSLYRTETYRPLAAVILEEELDEWCELPAGIRSLPFLSFAVRINKNKQNLLSGAMQLDGLARIQTVSRDSNPLLWNLIKSFGNKTGTSALLSTSFNNALEPAVESIEDAVTTFLSTEIDYFVVGDIVVKKNIGDLEDCRPLYLSLPPYVQVIRKKGMTERHKGVFNNEIMTTYSPEFRRTISPEIADLLINLDEEKPFGELVLSFGFDFKSHPELINELTELWKQRMVLLRPAKRLNILNE